MVRHVIYVPGLGDHRAHGQNIAIQLWRIFGLRPHYMPLGWNNGEGFNAKQKRLLELVDTLCATGDSVSLVGVSAGASAVLNTYAQSSNVSKVVCICGKINNPETISKQRLAANPDFGESMGSLAESMRSLKSKTKNILSIHPWRDQIVPPSETIIKGAKEMTLPGWNHVSGIFFGVVFGSYAISRFVRSDY